MSELKKAIESVILPSSEADKRISATAQGQGDNLQPGGGSSERAGQCWHRPCGSHRHLWGSLGLYKEACSLATRASQPRSGFPKDGLTWGTVELSGTGVVGATAFRAAEGAGAERIGICSLLKRDGRADGSSGANDGSDDD